MKRFVSLAPLLAAALLVPALASSQDKSARQDIEAANKQFAAAFAKGDAAAVASLYTTDAQAFPPNGEVVRGRAELQKMWQSVMASGIASAKVTTSEVESAGDLAYESGTYEMGTKDGKIADRGKYVVVWKRSSGKWMIHRDIWNTNMPAR